MIHFDLSMLDDRGTSKAIATLALFLEHGQADNILFESVLPVMSHSPQELMVPQKAGRSLFRDDSHGFDEGFFLFSGSKRCPSMKRSPSTFASE